MRHVFQWTMALGCLSVVTLLHQSPLEARGFSRGGGGGARMSGGGGGSRPSMSRSPSMSRPSMSRPSMPSRPSPSISRPSPSSRPNVSRPSVATRPQTSRPSIGTRPSVGTRPSTGSRPTRGQLDSFLDLKPSVGTRPGSGGSIGSNIAAGAAGGAAANFLRNNPRPSQLPAGGATTRPNLGDRTSIGDRTQVNIGDRPSQLPSNLANHRPERVENRQQLQGNRTQRRNQVREQYRDNHPRFDFWADHPDWARWRLNRPYRWAAWGAVTAWFPWGWSEPTYYNYGDNYYYQGDSVYSDGQPVASATEYAEQAQTIATAADVPAETQESDWMSLGVFALTQDGQASGPPPVAYLQLQVNKQGVITGTLQDLSSKSVRQVEGAVDKESQRSAWTVGGKSWPIMETGISNLTKDEAPALVHFENGQTQQWLMIRMDDPSDAQK